MSTALCRSQPVNRDTQAGFSLVLVLLVLGALAVASTLFLKSVSSVGRSVSASTSASMLEAIADAGVQMAILDLVAASRDAARQRRIPINAGTLRCVPAARVVLSVQVQDTGGLVDLNVGSDRLIQLLLRGLRLERAEALADAILDYRDSDNDRRPSGAEADEYFAAGRSQGPRNGPFLSIEELGQVLGMTAETVAALRPYVTLNSGLEGLDAAAARPELLEIIARGDLGDTFASTSSLPRGATIAQELRSTSMRRTFTIDVEARAGETRYIRRALIELTTSRARPFLIRSWARSDMQITQDAFEETTLPTC